jgi:Family of unknown function (DUF6788)
VPGIDDLGRFPVMVRGTLTTFRRRCGKPSCRCVSGEQHETPALMYRDGGKTRIVTLSQEDAARVAAALDRYQRARAELEAADEGIAALRARRAGTR